MPNNSLTPHELLNIHELLSFKTICATKSSVMQNVADDHELKDLMSRNIANEQKQIQELQGILTTNTTLH